MTTLSYVMDIEELTTRDKYLNVNWILRDLDFSLLTDVSEESSNKDKIDAITATLDYSNALGFYLNKDVVSFFTRKKICFSSEDCLLNIVYNAHVTIFIRCLNGLEESKKIVIQVDIPQILLNILGFKDEVNRFFTEGEVYGNFQHMDIDDIWIQNNI